MDSYTDKVSGKRITLTLSGRPKPVIKDDDKKDDKKDTTDDDDDDDDDDSTTKPTESEETNP